MDYEEIDPCEIAGGIDADEAAYDAEFDAMAAEQADYYDWNESEQWFDE